MSILQEIQEQLQDTEAAIAELDRVIAGSPSRALLSMGKSLQKRREELEIEFLKMAKEFGLKVCSYRLFKDNDRPKIAALASSLSDFQEMFSVTFDAIKNGPKERSQVGAEIEQSSAFEFAYAFTGSIGIVLTMPDEQVLFGGTEFDRTIATISEIVKSPSSEAIREHAKRLGSAPIRKVYKWARAHAGSLFGAEVDWLEGQESQQRFMIQAQEFEKLAATIAETSEEKNENYKLVGQLIGADTKRKTFHIQFEGGDEIKGWFKDAISESQTVTLPKLYRAILVKSTKTKFSTEEEESSWFLDRLETP